jgi:predicted helicase
MISNVIINNDDFYKNNLYNDQYNIVIETYKYFNNNNKGILNLFCRYGKTRTSCLFCKYSNYNKIIIIVPSLYLISQTYNEWIKFYDSNNILKISCHDYNDEKIIKTFYEKEQSIFIITYHSSYKLKKYYFDIGIFDEAHRTTGFINKNDKYNILLTSDKINKKLFLTATMKVFIGEINNYYSMDDRNIYGDVIESISALKALELNRICPYSIVTINVKDIEKEKEINIDEFLENINEEQQKKILEIYSKYIRIAYSLIETINKYEIKHVITFHTFILYCNFFKYLIQKISNLNIEVICGNDSKEKRKITKFEFFQMLKFGKKHIFSRQTEFQREIFDEIIEE